MNDLPAYRDARDVLADRIHWAVVTITHLIQRGRSEGWLSGSAVATELPPLDDLEAQLRARIAGSQQDVGTLPMEWLASRLGLDAREQAVLWLLACIELSPAVARLTQAFGSSESTELSAQVLLQLVPISVAQLDLLADRGLTEMTCDPRLPAQRRWVRANDRVIDLASGELGVDREIAGICELRVSDDSLPAVEVPDPVLQAFRAATPSLVLAQGADGSGRTTLLAKAAARCGIGVLRVAARELARDAERLSRQLRALARECALFGVAPLVEDLDQLDDDARARVDRELFRKIPGPVLASAAEGYRCEVSRPVVVHRVVTPTIEARAEIWRAALPDCDRAVIDDAAARYSATPGTIIAAAAAAVARNGGTAGKVVIEDVHEGLRTHVDDRLTDLATRVRGTQTWEDIVLPSDQFDQLVELVARVRHRRQVLETWGFAEKVGRGLGLAALFSGPPGTGKTMAAGLLAQELGLDLYQVDLSRVVSKYIGETEKNLARIFDAAESGHAILLFDEAESLFAKRSEVKSSNDRYANLEVNFLLQRIEQFSGISLLTTNHERSIDEAFRRRLAVHVRFSAPDTEQRDLLWRAMLPKRADIAGEIDFDALAQDFEMTGGYIKNAALRAAYLAAHEGSAITMGQLMRAARAEYEAMGKLAFEAS